MQYLCTGCIYMVWSRINTRRQQKDNVVRTQLEHMNEEALAEGCSRHHEAARRELYERYGGMMLAVCLRYAGNRELAQDWMHDGFCKIFSAFHKFEWRGPGSLRAWMERVMVNVSLQHLREHNVLDTAVDFDEAPQAYEEPYHEAVQKIPPRVLMQFIGRLPAGYRTVFNLAVIEGRTHKEIASLLGINERSSSSQLARAKAALARMVQRWMDENETGYE